MTKAYDLDNPPVILDRVTINYGVMAGRIGEVREVDTPNKLLRAHAPGMMTQETVLLRWDQVEPL